MKNNDSVFFSMVYVITSKIPVGSVATYGQIAMLAGNPRASRIVGYAMHGAGGRDLPCHRVVNRLGELSPPEIFGEGEQRRLLEQEGITFLANGRIDMKKHLWNPSALL